MSTHPRRRGELVERADSENWAVYDETTDSLHLLNDTARAIWELCDGSTSPEEITRAIVELTGIESEVAARDVAATLDTLSDLGLVES